MASSLLAIQVTYSYIYHLTCRSVLQLVSTPDYWWGAAWGPYQHLSRLPQNTFFKETKVLKTLIITLEFCVLLAPLLHSWLPDVLPCLLGRLLQHLWVVWLGQLSPLLWCMRLTGSSTRLLSQPRAVAAAPGPLSCAGDGHLR